VQQCGAGLVRIPQAAGRFAFAAPALVRSDRLDESEVGLLLADAETVLALEPPRAAIGEFARIGVIGPHRAGSDAAFEVRGLTSKNGLGGDPVTGSLNAAIAQWLIPIGKAPRHCTAIQGSRMQRCGRIHVEQVEDDIWVGGDTVLGVTGAVSL